MMPNVFSTCCAAASLGLKLFYPSSEDDKLLAAEEGGVKGTKKALNIPKEFTPMKPAPSKSNAGTSSTAERLSRSRAVETRAESVPTKPVAAADGGVGADGGTGGADGGTGGCC